MTRQLGSRRAHLGIAGTNIEQEPLVPHRWDIETDVVVARLGTEGRHTASDPFGRSPRTNQWMKSDDYPNRRPSECLGKRTCCGKLLRR
jgi:hypothetical protein